MKTHFVYFSQKHGIYGENIDNSSIEHKSATVVVMLSIQYLIKRKSNLRIKGKKLRLQLVTPTVRYSEGSLFQRFDSPNIK